MSVGPRWRTWRDAMAEALYGADGFYRRPGAPAANFRTSAHSSPLWAAAIAELARRVDVALGEPPSFTVVDVGAGGGELLAAMAPAAPARWRLVGVDVCVRPGGLPERVAWAGELPAAVDGLLVAVEWLDVVPVDVVELTEAGLRLVEVADDGSERATARVPPASASWVGSWWSPVDVGDRAEVGLTRDASWSEAVARIDRGVAVAVDYATDPGRDVAGTLTGFRAGRQVAPRPDGSCDITAHVLLESCRAAAAADASVLVAQRDALRALGVHGRRPAYDGDPVAYLQKLSAAGEAAELLDPGGLGAFTWLVQAKGVPLPL